jgi:hypothetical protein
MFAAFWITYMSTCALYSITVLPIWGNRALVRRTTYPESAAWYAAQVAKLTVPLAYNFLTFLPKEVHQKTMFYRFLGQYVNLTPLGRGFSGFFPVLLVVPALAALFGWYGRVKAVLGFDDLLAEDERLDMWREGKVLVERHVKLRAGGMVVSPGSRDASLDLPRENGAPARGGPSSSSSLRPAAHGPLSSSSSSASAAARPPPRATGGSRAERRPLMRDDVPDHEEGSFFADFAHRVRNTLDTVERPAWLRRGSQQEDASVGDQSWDWNRIFGGGPGRVRL